MHRGVLGRIAGEGVSKASLRRLIDEVNGGLLPYQRIDRSRVLGTPLAVGSTKKIKGFTVD